MNLKHSALKHIFKTDYGPDSKTTWKILLGCGQIMLKLNVFVLRWGIMYKECFVFSRNYYEKNVYNIFYNFSEVVAWGCSIENVFWKNSQGKHLCQSLYVNNVAVWGLQPY